MPLVHPTTVLTFSSEDPNHPASNLLNRDTYRKWKCRKVGEEKAWVVLKFEKAVQITSVDIGNESSAVLEIFVGRSGGFGEVKYEPLLNSSILMSANESRALDNICGVRSYPPSSLDKETSSQKWDLVKLVVSQPFNKQTQFGLTFAKFTTPPDPDAPVKIGAFTLKKPLNTSDDDLLEDEEPVRIGAMFAKSLANKSGSGGDPSNESTTNAAIRQVTKAISGASQSSSVDAVKDAVKRSKLDVSTTSFAPSMSTPVYPKRKSTSLSVTTPQTPGGSGDTKNNKQLIDIPAKTTKSNQSQGPSSSSPLSGGGSGSGRPSSSGRLPDDDEELAAAVEDAKPRKPFDKLFEGVVFVMSGFENPYRRNLRDRAISMGAKCKQDWDSSCTHLICAFVNTPKFREVRASRNNGKIVRKEWIERSFGARMRFPWRRFCLDRNDNGPDSEEEIEEEDEAEEGEEVGQSGGSPPRNGGELEESGVLPMELVESVMEEVETTEDTCPQRTGEEVGTGNKRKRPVEEMMEVVNGDNQSDNHKQEEELYSADTDVDDEQSADEGVSAPEVARNKVSSTDLSPGPGLDAAESPDDQDPSAGADESGFFQYFTFFVMCPKGSSFKEKDQIEQIISQRKGKVEQELKEEVDYLITNRDDWSEDFSEALSDNPNIVVVKAAWIQKCVQENKILSFEEFMLTPC